MVQGTGKAADVSKIVAAMINTAGAGLRQILAASRLASLAMIISTMMLNEKTREWNQPLRVGAIDFMKAVDTVEHNYLCDAFMEARVPGPYINEQRISKSSR